MGITTPLALRWERAQQIDRSAIQDMGQGWFYVPSTKGPAGYAVSLEFDAEGKLTAASCSCHDFEKRTEGKGTPELHGVRVCKHVLAASLKAKDAQPKPTIPEPPYNGHTKPVLGDREPHGAEATKIAPDGLPVASKPVWDRETEERVLTASNGFHYCGATASECIRQFQEALHYQAEHLRKNGHNLAEVCRAEVAFDCPPTAQHVEPAKAPADENRRQALSRARGIANQARPALGPTYRLHGVGEGDVLDWSDQALFLAVVNVLPEGLCAKGVSQAEPWGTVREIRMTAATVHLRLKEGWMTKVGNLRR